MKLRTVLLTAAGWLVTLAFLAPYAEMLLTALKPTPELMKRYSTPSQAFVAGPELRRASPPFDAAPSSVAAYI